MRLIMVIAGVLGWAAPALAHLSRPTNREPEPLQYDPEDPVLVFRSPGAGFQIFYVVEGRNGVGAEDTDRDGVVDRIERIAEAYDAALATFTSTLGFDPPPSDEDQFLENGGDGRTDVYVLDTAQIPGGRLLEGCSMERPTACWSFIVHPVAGFDDTLIAKRALFRAILGGYRANFDAPLEIGTAAWAAEDESTFERHLASPEVSLGDSGASEDGGTALFLTFLSGRYGKSLVRELWIEIGAAGRSPMWKELLNGLLVKRGSSLALEFAEYALANLDRGVRIDRLPNSGVGPIAGLSARYFRAGSTGRVTAAVVGGDELDLALIGADGAISRGTGAAPPAIDSTVDVVLAVINGRVDPIAPSALCVGSADDVRDCGEQGCTCASRGGWDWSSALLLAAILPLIARRGATL